MSAPELMSCPFCGEEQPLHDDTSWVRCLCCGAKTGWWPTGDEAAAAWNTRADTATWNAAIQKAAFIAHSGVEAYGAKMRGATDKKEKRDWQSMLMAAVDIEHAILALLKDEK